MCKSCRSRKILKNALAIVAVDTAENGPSKVRQVTNKVCRNIGMGSAGQVAKIRFLNVAQAGWGAPVVVGQAVEPQGNKFDPQTGQPIPKFDPYSGQQNW